MALTALIVDDEPLAREWIRSGLAAETDVEIVGECGDGFQAVQKIGELAPRLIFLDVQMPGLNGFQATRAITREEKTKHIPVIICTTKDQETDKIWGLRQGAKDYITKPLSESDLLEKIKALS